jgi:uncharacterized protein (DUF1330 family)
MAGYVIADVEVTDAELFEKYRKLVPATVEAFGGRYIVRGGASEVVEGEGTPHRTVIIEFENFEKAKAWHSSEEYAGPKQMRIDSTNSSVIIVDGV